MAGPAAPLAVVSATPAMPGFDRLLAASLAEGFGMVRRLRDEWDDGSNVFSRTGELLLGAKRDGELVGLCGRNVDPYSDDPAMGRVRHLYVRPDCRGLGIGHALLNGVIDDAARFFDALKLRAPKSAFGFYERAGFRRVHEASATHAVWLRTETIAQGRAI